MLIISSSWLLLLLLNYYRYQYSGYYTMSQKTRQIFGKL